MSPTGIRYNAAVSARKAFEKAWGERSGRFGEDGPDPLLAALRAYESGMLRGLRKEAKRRGKVFEAFLQSAIESLGEKIPKDV